MQVSVDPGPIDPSVLTLQATHRSEDVWRGLDVQVDRRREHLRTIFHMQVDPRILHYVRLVGFYGVDRLVSTLHIDRALLTALLGRWRQETHTFHLLMGEVTITLGDVVVLAGLPIEGRAVTGSACRVWVDLVHILLGVRPHAGTHIRGSALGTAWLR
ncbi:unnamed protein product [Cuscuta europaea]|uniref:Aminotransferase-like plant mobile domain-containing protein n=1 Tax=Cuscuta europaea TaxID=41803 RepID=A0A9P0Z086_CUSEU|nr:unnamed protein product [Cuscuta europaea]